MAVSFENDIMPLFKQFRAPMLWRLDLTSYEDVVANANTIQGLISTQQMPPPPFQPLTTDQVNTFNNWMSAGYPR